MMGARFNPCMKPVLALNGTGGLYCPTGARGTLSGGQCTSYDLEHFCGLSGFSKAEPDQWFRFITAIFLHSGVVHWFLNTLFQLRTGLQMERDYGSWRIAIIFMMSGIGGFIFSANFDGAKPQAGVGGSGALYGTWKKDQRNSMALIKSCRAYGVLVVGLISELEADCTTMEGTN